MISVSWGAMPPVQRPSTISLRDIAEDVCRKRGISINDFMSARRTKNVAMARQEAYWRAREETRASLPQIGRAYGGRDHTTILWGIRRHQARLDKVANGTP